MNSLNGIPAETSIVSTTAPAHLPPGEPDAGFVDDEPFDWRRLTAAIWRFRWLVLAVTVVGTAAGAVATRFVHPRYVTQATIWIDARDPAESRAGGMAPIQPGRLLDPEAWVDLLQSYVVLDSVVRQQHLYLTFHDRRDTALVAGFDLGDTFRPGSYVVSTDSGGRNYVLRTGSGTELERGAAGDSIGRAVGFRWAPAPGALRPGRKIGFTVLTPRDAARDLGKELDVRIDPEGNFLRIALQGTSPEHLAAVVNAVAARYVAVAAALKRQKLTDVTGILDQQLQTAQGSLASAESALEVFGVRTATLPRGGAESGTPLDRAATGAAPATDRYFRLVARRDELRQQQATIHRALDQLSNGQIGTGALSGLPEGGRTTPLAQALTELATKQTDLRALRYRYSDSYPAVVQLTGEIATLERQTIPTLARQLSAELDAEAQGVEAEVARAATDLRQIPSRAVEEARLRRNVVLAENLYTGLQQRYNEARLAEVSAVPDVRILDAAVAPQQPVSDVTARILLLAFGGSLGLGVAGAALLDRTDRKVRYPSEVSRGMGLSILGAVPHLRMAAGSAGGPPATESVDAVIEALRGVRLGLVYAAAPNEPLVFAVSSPGSGEGKSFLSANLGLAFAESGKRTLVVDGDLRHGLLHRRFGRQRRPGFAELLRGEVSLADTIQPTAFPGLDLLACGARAQNAPELLGGPAMEQFLAQARATYDVVIIDTPPLGACVDPYVLAAAAGHLAVVLRTGVSERELMRAKLDALARLPIRMLGVVLNDVPAAAAYRSYSYQLTGYEAVEEERGRVGAVV